MAAAADDSFSVEQSTIGAASNFDTEDGQHLSPYGEGMKIPSSARSMLNLHSVISKIKQAQDDLTKVLCNKGHRMDKCRPGIDTTWDSHTCDRCHRQHIMEPEPIFRCWDCNYDECEKCATLKHVPMTPMGTTKSLHSLLLDGAEADISPAKLGQPLVDLLSADAEILAKTEEEQIAKIVQLEADLQAATERIPYLERLEKQATERAKQMQLQLQKEADKAKNLEQRNDELASLMDAAKHAAMETEKGLKMTIDDLEASERHKDERIMQQKKMQEEEEELIAQQRKTHEVAIEREKGLLKQIAELEKSEKEKDEQLAKAKKRHEKDEKTIEKKQKEHHDAVEREKGLLKQVAELEQNEKEKDEQIAEQKKAHEEDKSLIAQQRKTHEASVEREKGLLKQVAGLEKSEKDKDEIIGKFKKTHEKDAKTIAQQKKEHEEAVEREKFLLKQVAELERNEREKDELIAQQKKMQEEEEQLIVQQRKTHEMSMEREKMFVKQVADLESSERKNKELVMQQRQQIDDEKLSLTLLEQSLSSQTKLVEKMQWELDEARKSQVERQARMVALEREMGEDQARAREAERSSHSRIESLTQELSLGRHHHEAIERRYVDQEKGLLASNSRVHELEAQVTTLRGSVDEKRLELETRDLELQRGRDELHRAREEAQRAHEEERRAHEDTKRTRALLQRELEQSSAELDRVRQASQAAERSYEDQQLIVKEAGHELRTKLQALQNSMDEKDIQLRSAQHTARTTEQSLLTRIEEMSTELHTTRQTAQRAQQQIGEERAEEVQALTLKQKELQGQISSLTLSLQSKETLMIEESQGHLRQIEKLSTELTASQHAMQGQEQRSNRLEALLKELGVSEKEFLRQIAALQANLMEKDLQLQRDCDVSQQVRARLERQMEQQTIQQEAEVQKYQLQIEQLHSEQRKLRDEKDLQLQKGSEEFRGAEKQHQVAIEKLNSELRTVRGEKEQELQKSLEEAKRTERQHQAAIEKLNTDIRSMQGDRELQLQEVSREHRTAVEKLNSELRSMQAEKDKELQEAQRAHADAMIVLASEKDQKLQANQDAAREAESQLRVAMDTLASEKDLKLQRNLDAAQEAEIQHRAAVEKLNSELRTMQGEKDMQLQEVQMQHQGAMERLASEKDLQLQKNLDATLEAESQHRAAMEKLTSELHALQQYAEAEGQRLEALQSTIEKMEESEKTLVGSVLSEVQSVRTEMSKEWPQQTVRLRALEDQVRAYHHEADGLKTNMNKLADAAVAAHARCAGLEKRPVFVRMEYPGGPHMKALMPTPLPSTSGSPTPRRTSSPGRMWINKAPASAAGSIRITAPGSDAGNVRVEPHLTSRIQTSSRGASVQTAASSAQDAPAGMVPAIYMQTSSRPDLFNQMDANHDGVISRQEWHQYQGVQASPRADYVSYATTTTRMQHAPGAAGSETPDEISTSRSETQRMRI